MTATYFLVKYELFMSFVEQVFVLVLTNAHHWMLEVQAAIYDLDSELGDIIWLILISCTYSVVAIQGMA